MKLPKAYLLLLFLLSGGKPPAYAQPDKFLLLTHRLDSLQKLPPSFGRDTLITMTTIDLAMYKAGSVNVDSARKEVQKAIALAERINWIQGQLLAYRMLAQVESTNSKYYSSIEVAQKGLQLAEKAKNSFMEAAFLRVLGDAYHWLEKPEKALYYFDLQIKKSNEPSDLLAGTLIDIGEIETKQKHYDKALTNIQKGIDIAQQLKMPVFEGYGFTTLGLWAKAQNRFDEAQSYFSKALTLYNQSKADYLATDVQNYLASIFLLQKKYPQAIDWAEKAFQNAQRLSIFYSARDACQTLYQCHKAQNDVSKALYYHENWMKYKDLMEEQNVNQRLEGLQYAYENKKQQEQITNQSLENQRQKQANYLLLGGLGLILLLVAILWLGNRKLKSKNAEIGVYQAELQSLNTDLENRVEQRTTELLATRKELYEQETDYRRQLAEIEMTALRAQMNPHFIFNVLNSINNFTLSNHAEEASIYLTKFSKLIRTVLENSKADLVSLANELESLRIYIELEEMRFKGKIVSTFVIDPAIDQRYVQLPPLLLQPYIENAIWHGLMHQPEGGKLTLTATQPDENLLRIEILDNGIGRAKAKELKSKSATRDKSFGMQITSDRLKMFSQLYNLDTKITIEDLTNPTGTKVVLEIPV